MSPKRLNFPPNSESIVWGKVPQYVCGGFQGVCSGSSMITKKGLLVARCLSTVSPSNMVSIKVMNPTNGTITLNKNRQFGEFNLLDDTINIVPNIKSNCTHAEIKEDKDQMGQRNNNKRRSSEDKFLSYFDMEANDLLSSQQSQLNELLVKNKELFVTKENPKLGLTDLVEHQIHLKHVAVSIHQRPYKLPPHKRDILRHQLDELLSQGIIAPVNEKEDIPISSPIVLVSNSKRNRPNSGLKTCSKEESLSMYRFCIDFRYLNSNTQDFRYAIPNVDELTESFTQRIPNFISSIDLSSDFFQLLISLESTKYAAFNTCFGTYRIHVFVMYIELFFFIKF